MLRLQTPLPERYTTASADELADMIGAAKAALGSRRLRPRPPLPARRGHALGRRPGRLLRAVPHRGRPARGRVHRVLRRALHGRVGRHPHRRPPAGAPARPQRRLLHGRHGRHRPGRGGLGRPGPSDRRRPPRPGHLHELLRRAQGVRRPPRRGGVHLVQRAGRAHLGARARASAVLFFPDQHLGRNTGYQLGYGADDMGVWNPRLAMGGLDRPRGQGVDPAALEGPLLGPPALPARARRGLPGRAPRRHRDGPPRVRPRGGRAGRRGRARPTPSSAPSTPLPTGR